MNFYEEAASGAAGCTPLETICAIESPPDIHVSDAVSQVKQGSACLCRGVGGTQC